MTTTFPEIIKNSAKQFPDKEAFRSGNTSITYQELAIKTTQLARFFIDNGVQKGDRIGVYLNRCLDTAIAIYGIMKAGAIYVPLDPTAPSSRSRFLITDCGIKYLVSNQIQHRKLVEIIEQSPDLAGVIGLSIADSTTPTIPWSTIFQLATDTLSVRVMEHDLAYIIYTSGSTGTPKGIMHSHHSGLAYAKLTANLYQLSPVDRIGNHAPIHFDISTLGYFSGPFVGATTIIIGDAYTKLPASLSSLIEKEKLTVWYSVPLALVQLLQKGAIEQKDFSTLRWVLYGGEPFPLKYLRVFLDLLPHATFSNVYGPAEVNQCTYYNFKTLPESATTVPIGQTWNNTEVLIVDSNDRIIKSGEIGELLVRSSTRMTGYWKQPELTKKSFYKKVTTTGVNQYFYRTGDLVQRQKDGQLIFLGRKDRQIKTRGYRVELDEVEAAILTNKSVQEAVTFVVEAQNIKIIYGAVILKEDVSLSAKELYQYLGARLPYYAIPEKIEFRKTFPRTSTGKVNRPLLKQETNITPAS